MKRQNLINYLKSVIYKNDNNEIDAEKHQSLETQILNDVAVIEDDFISDPAAATPRNTFNAVFVKQQLNNLAGGFKNRQNPVTNVADLATTYPNATSDGWAAMVTSVGYIYAYNESGNWVNTGLTAFPEDVATQEDIDAAIDAEVISRNAELAKKQNKAIVFSQLNADPDITLATEGDKAWNNTYNKIYTAILVNSALTWANPVNAEYGVMYIYGTQNYQLKDGLMVVVGDNTGGGVTATVNGDSVNTAIENDYTPQTGQIGDTNKFVSIGKKTISALIVWNYIKSKLLNVAIDLNSGTTIGAKKPVTSINNIEADTNGNIEITGGGEIDDEDIAEDKTWSSFKTNEELSNKADIDDLQNGNLIPKTSLNALRLVNSTDEEDGQTMYMGRDGKGKIFDEASHQSYDVIDDRRIETEGIGTIDAAFSSGLYNNENILTIGVSPFLTFGASVDYQTIRQVKLLFKVSDVITAKTFKLNIQNQDANMQLDFVNGVVETINGTEYLTLSITDSSPYPYTTNTSMFEIIREGVDLSKIPTINRVNALLANYTLNSQIQGDLTPDPTGLKIPNINALITALSQRPPGGSLSAGYVYLSNAASTVDDTYKALSYTLDTTATTITATANNNTVLVGKWLYPDAIAVTSIPNGLWTLFANRMVSNSAGTSNTISTVFVYHTDGSTTDLFSVTSDEINDTVMTDKYAELGVSIQTCLATDRLGIRVEFRTTRTSNTTLSLILGDGKAARFSTPLPARHNGLRDLNGDPNFQHITQSEKDGFKTKEIIITHLGYNGLLHPNSYKNNSVAKTITGYRLSSNATDFSVTIAGNNYTKANITNVVLPADAELVVNSIDIVAGKDVANAVLTIQ